MIHVPEELLEQFERGNVIPLVGDLINEGALPTDRELAEELAGRCAYPPEEQIVLDRVAGYHLLTTHDRHGLIAFLRDRLDRPEVEPSPSHRLIARLCPRVVVTSCYDNLMARAVQEAEIGYTPVIRNEEVAYGDEQKMMLVWLRGLLDRPDSMIITADDHRRFLSGRESLSDVLRGELARRTWFFVGFDLQHEWFPHYYDSVTHGLDHHRRRAYVLGTTGSAYTRAWWSERAQLLDVEMEPFLEALVSQVEARRRPVAPQTGKVPATVEDGKTEEEASQPLPERPYKLLDFYEAADAAIFFGREVETQALTALIHAHRLTLLYGASGTGKTSLLLAGVAPRLMQGQNGYEFFHLRALEEPGSIIRSAIRRRCPELALPDTLSLVDFVGAAAEAMGSTLVLVLDQFEEFFIRFNPERRQTFVAALGALNDARDVPVKIVLSLREDWLAAVNEIRERIPEVFYNDRRLLPLTRQQARQAITGPVERMGMRYDPALVERLLDDLAEGGAQPGQNETALVMPPQLQLVCNAVYERASGQGRQLITLADYEAVGGAEGILVRYVEEALAEYHGQDREIARTVLTALVTSQDTKTGSTVDELAAEAGVAKATLLPVLSRLMGQRLVRGLEDGERYELAHDILASTIGGWITEQERERKRVQEMLRREVADWRQDPRILLGQTKFEQVNALREDLPLTAEEEQFLLRAAVLYDIEAGYWLDRTGDTEEQIDILLEMLQREPAARLTAARMLAAFPQERVASALAAAAVDDPEVAVRDAAALSLGRGAMASGISRLAEVARTESGPRRSHAVRVLALVKEVDPGQLAQSNPPGFEVNAMLAQIRLQRAAPGIRAMVAAGALGGALALGVGLMPSIGLHFLQTAFAESFILVTIQLSVLGVVAGALLGLGMSVGGALAGGRAALGRVIGGVLLGALGFAVALLPVSTAENLAGGLLGAAVLGAAVALGITLAMAVARERRGPIVIGGALGGALGLPLWGLWAFRPFWEGTVPLFLQVLSGALSGLILALVFVWAYSFMIGEDERAPDEQ